MIIKKLVMVVALFVVIGGSDALSQQSEVFDKERFLEMAQSGILLRLTPEEIRRKIKEAGLTEEEAIRLTRERNIDLEKHLRAEAGVRATLEETRQIATEVTPRSPAPAGHVFEEVGTPVEFRQRGIGLLPFGYAIFQRAPSAFEPIVNVATPPGYALGPGDEIVLNVWGETQLNYTLTVARDGYVIIPDVGKVQLSGQTIEQARRVLLERMSAVYAGLQRGAPDATSFLDVSIGKLRTIQIFVLGEARAPGGYSLSGLSTAFTALYYSGGPNLEGSLRDIRLFREGMLEKQIDFYDFALTGNKENDVRLQEGDLLFINPVGRRVAIQGSVRRPAIYELKNDEDFSDLLRMAGGLRDDAYIKRVHIERIVPFHQRHLYERDVVDIDLNFASHEELVASRVSLESGDIVTFFSVNMELENRVTITGNVYKPGVFELTSGMTVSDLIRRADGLREDTFLERGTIIRTRQEDLRKEVLSFSVREALNGDLQHNVPLQRLDVVSVYHESVFRPTHTVYIDGAVRNPGAYVRAEGMHVSDLIVLAGGVTDGADLSTIEVARRNITATDSLAKIIRVSLPREYWAARNPHDVLLEDFDIVSVRMKPEYSELRTVYVTGEAVFPGTYTLRAEGERISELIIRMGGFKKTAYLPGVHIVRNPGVGGVHPVSPSIVDASIIDTLGRPLPLVPRMATSQVPIDIQKVLRNPNSAHNLVLQPGDVVVVPRDPGVVYVQGQVNTPSSVPYKKGGSVNYYVKQAGGLTRNADEKNIVVILPNGKKWEPSGFFLTRNPEILSGSTIIVATKLPEKDRTLPLLKEWASITLSAVTMAYIVWQVSK